MYARARYASAMSIDRQHVAWVVEQLRELGPVSSRLMFGGAGLYYDEMFFALIADRILYLKVDDSNRADFEARGTGPFQPFPDKPMTMSYYAVPEDIVESPHELAEWARRAVEVARRAPRKKSKRKTRRAKSQTDPLSDDTPIGKLRNLGPTSTAWLAAAGVRTRGDLRQRGAAATYLAVAAKQGNVSLNLLYALEAALMDLNVTLLPSAIKDSLRQRIGR